ncbi:MAG: chromosome partitioning protein ParB [Burkholderiaceae bacterium]
MTASRRPPRQFATRPRNPEAWVAAPETATGTPAARPANSARLTVDVTPALRQRIKLAALRRGTTLADLLRAMLYDAFPDDEGAAP